MELYELEGDIQTIVDKERSLLDIRSQNIVKTWSYDESNETVSYPNAELLIRLYQNLNEETLKNRFIEIARSKVSEDSERITDYGYVSYHGMLKKIVSCSQLFLYVLIKLNYTDDALRALDTRSGLCSYQHVNLIEGKSQS